MAKLTDARVVTLQGHFNTGDQPSEANFADLIQWIQEGIEEHDHAAGGDGDGISDLVGLTSLGLGTLTPFVPAGYVGVPFTLESQSPNITFTDVGTADVTRFIGNSAGTFYLGICDDDGANTANHVAIDTIGRVTIPDLAGVGVRNVSADANGRLVIA